METITCVKCGAETERMPEPPLGGPVGREVQANVCASCWGEWQAQSALIINHYGLQLFNPEHRAQLLAMMREYLGLPSPA